MTTGTFHAAANPVSGDLAAPAADYIRPVPEPRNTASHVHGESFRANHQLKHRVILGMPLSVATMDDVVQICRNALGTPRITQIGVVNAAKMVKLRQDVELRDSLLTCDFIIADGQSVVWASRLLRRRLPERIAGIDLFERLLELAAEESRSVYLLGARPDVLEKLQAEIQKRFPGLRIAGANHGYFHDDDAASIAADIKESGASMLFLGMTSPKKEIFVGEWGSQLGVSVVHGVGGSFDVLAGVTKRAPARWQRAGMEWLYRLLQEPGRLWRRYLVTNVAFVALVAGELMRPTTPYRHTGPHR